MSVVQYQIRNLSNDKSSPVEWLVKFYYSCFGVSREAFFEGIIPSYLCNISF